VKVLVSHIRESIGESTGHGESVVTALQLTDIVVKGPSGLNRCVKITSDGIPPFLPRLAASLDEIACLGLPGILCESLA
jgi:hypothetical protein